MSELKRLAYSIIDFLREQTRSQAWNSDERESLEVAMQCLENVFKISSRDIHLAVSPPLTEIFSAAVTKDLIWNTPSGFTPSAQDAIRAEQLKNEGNNYIKEENYRAAVDSYSQAIELDPNSAVYFCNRAAAQSKLNNYTAAIEDCKRAIAIDPDYSKAYGRMGLALTSLNKHSEAITYYQKAVELDPENGTFISNLRVAEQKIGEASSPTGAGLGVDLASLLNNPSFVSMAASLMQNPQLQQLMSGMMSNAISGPAAGVGGLTDMGSLIQAGQQFAQQMQEENPELIEQLRNQIRTRSFSGSNEDQS
ncbi:small glutamine-rich tetratricopeptide repeat-containing protein beta isoform X2 [Scyliorhinus canicula]|uniref:small glutamine-rich tetratricopeptide repeat-containing protein beta isoform X2 n=1 Tax=Scyliorhinus canicula TaxID=7830 RepID=UPI0018F517C2|nr:small glutamine-rich tetratricopeptide repeat-containing protein beta isoform X2 [Scyliorhinus canicula]